MNPRLDGFHEEAQRLQRGIEDVRATGRQSDNFAKENIQLNPSMTFQSGFSEFASNSFNETHSCSFNRESVVSSNAFEASIAIRPSSFSLELHESLHSNLSTGDALYFQREESGRNTMNLSRDYCRLLRSWMRTSRQNIEYLNQHCELSKRRILQLEEQLRNNSRCGEEILGEIRAFKSESNTWFLLIHLANAAQDTQDEPSIGEAYSHKLIAERLLRKNKDVRLQFAVTTWLEQSIGEMHCYKTRKTMSNRENSGALSDPDAKTRDMRRDLEEGSYGESLMKGVWCFIRCGKLNTAIEVLKRNGLLWMAATLNSVNLWHASRSEAVQSDGTANYMKCKYIARNLAKNATSVYEKAIYGVLGGDIDASLAATSQSLEDSMWVYFKHTSDSRLEAAMYDQLKNPLDKYDLMESEEHTKKCPQTSKFVASQPKCFSFEDVFRQLETNDSIKAQCKGVYFELQRMFILTYANTGTTSQTIVDYLASRMRNQSLQPEFLQFAVHIYLYLVPQCPMQDMDDPGVQIIKRYVGYLAENDKDLVCVYCCLLPRKIRIETFASFLRRTDDPSERQKYLQAAEEFFEDDILDVTRQLVADVMKEDISSSSFSRHRSTLSKLDRQKIEVVKCLLLQQQYKETLVQANNLFRSFLKMCRIFDGNPSERDSGKTFRIYMNEKHTKCLNICLGKLEAAVHLLKEVDTLRTKIDASIGEEKTNSDYDSAKELEGEAYEFECWRQFVMSMNWFDRWSQHQKNEPKPVEPRRKGDLDTRFNQQMMSHQERARVFQDRRLEIVGKALRFFGSALCSDGGWLCEHKCVHNGNLHERRKQLGEARFNMTPILVFLLHEMLYTSGEHTKSWALIRYITDQKYALYQSFHKKHALWFLQLLLKSSLMILIP